MITDNLIDIVDHQKKTTPRIVKTNPTILQVIGASEKEEVPMLQKQRRSLATRMILPGTLFLMFGAVIAAIKLIPEFEALRTENLHTPWGTGVASIATALFVMQIGFLLYMLALYLRYKPIQSVCDELLPTCTVIVPAYNEGKLVYHTLLSLAQSNYPNEKLELIAIDDGSKDDTWQWMLKAKQELGDRVSIYQQPQNKGKRHALYRGFKLATGTVLVTVDSDSIVDKDTLRNMTSPFVVNKDCGGVAGNVLALNKKAIIPKMLNVSFAFTFGFLRSAQSVLGSVFCTPGALAAYRKDAVMNCLPEWMNQTFMGKPSDIGEDRAMTNMVLKQGYHVLFQSNASVYTNVPETYKGLYKMFIRWERSNVRESIAMGQFGFKNFREGKKTAIRVLLVDQWIKILFCIPAVVIMLSFVLAHPVLFLTSTLASILIYSSIQSIFYAKKHNVKEALWAYPYAIFYVFSLFWITPYSLATAAKAGWLTRELPKAKENRLALSGAM